MQLQQQRAFILQGSITNEQQQYFNTYGIIHFKNFIDKNTVSLFIDEIKNIEQQLLNTNTEKINGVPLKYGTGIHGEKLIQRIAFVSQYSTVLSNLLTTEKVKSLVKLLGPYDGRIGENEKDGLVLNHYINTEESKFSKLGWHTDSPRDLFLGSKILPMLNVGLHLDDCPQSNGGLRVLPGTHNQGLFKLLFKKKYFIDHTPDKNEKGFDIEAGDLTVHDGRLWHRVQQSPHTGEKSRRRVMYIPVITGNYRPKTANSPTPFYHKLGQLGTGVYARKLKWAALKIGTKKLAGF
jgi:phytanoyl-CoA hydroxylase